VGSYAGAGLEEDDQRDETFREMSEEQPEPEHNTYFLPHPLVSVASWIWAAKAESKKRDL
jgi:hypothetical protein